MRTVVSLLCILSLLSVSLGAETDGQSRNVVVVPAGDVQKTDMFLIGKDCQIHGKVESSVIAIGGSIEISGHIQEDLICFASTVTIKDGALIEKDLFVIGGKLTKGETCIVKGESFYVRFDMKEIENTLIPILSDSRAVTFLKTAKIILWFIIALVVLALFPLKINEAGKILEKFPLKIGTIGLVSVFGLIFLLMIFVLLSFFLVGIPFLFLLIIFYFMVHVLGRTVVLYYIGLKISQGAGLKRITPAFYILLGIIVYFLLKFIPVLGALVLIILKIFEIGIGIGFFLRKKLHLQIQE